MADHDIPLPRRQGSGGRRRESLRGLTLAAALLLLALSASSPARAQLANDEVPRQRTVEAREALDGELRASRFRLGPVRMLPRLLLKNAGYDNNVFGTSEGPVADWTATVSLGTRLILPMGSKLYWTGDAWPEYTWYRTLTARNGLGGFYRSSLLAFFNRMSVEIAGSYTDSLSYLNSETETRVRQKTSGGAARVEIDLTRSVALFAGAVTQRIRVSGGSGEPAGLVDPHLYDRTEEAARGGLRFRLSGDWNVSVGAEATRTTFAEVPEERDNRSVAILGGVFYNRPRLFVNLLAGFRWGRPINGSVFPDYSTPTGSYFVSYQATKVVEVQLHGGRRIVYGQVQDNPYYVETRYGLSLLLHVLRNVALQGVGALGTNAYLFAGPAEGRRSDRYHSVGGGLTVGVAGRFLLSALVEHPTYTSNVPGADRSALRFTTGISFQREISP